MHLSTVKYNSTGVHCEIPWLYYCKHVYKYMSLTTDYKIEKFYTRILKICKNSLKDIVIVVGN